MPYYILISILAFSLGKTAIGCTAATILIVVAVCSFSRWVAVESKKQADNMGALKKASEQIASMERRLKENAK